MAELKRILHVEDDVSIQAVTRMALERLGGYEVKSCLSGQEALGCVDDFNPQLILLDVMMPGMDGPATLLALRERIDLSGLPVVFMTAKVCPQEREHYQALGASALIVKPFDALALSEEVQRIWSRLHE